MSILVQSVSIQQLKHEFESFLTLSVPRGVLHSHGSIGHPWDLRSLRRPPKGDFSVKMHF